MRILALLGALLVAALAWTLATPHRALPDSDSTRADTTDALTASPAPADATQGPAERLELNADPKPAAEPQTELYGWVVLTDGAPAARARVTIQPDVEQPGTWFADTDDVGHFVWTGPAVAKRWRLQARHLEAISGKIEVDTPLATPPTLTIVGAALIRGRVYDPMGRPAKAQVRAIWNDERGWRKAQVQETEQDGSFTLGVSGPGEHVVIAQSSDYFASPYQIVELDGSIVEVVLQLRRGAELQGIVERADGTPVPDYQVRVWPSSSDAWPKTGVSVNQDDILPMPRPELTAEDGSFRCWVPADLTYTVSSYHTSSWFAQPPRVEDARPGQPVRLVIPELTLATSRITFVLPNGRPARLLDASVHVKIDGRRHMGGVPRERLREGVVALEELPRDHPFIVRTRIEGWGRYEAGPWIAEESSEHTVHLPALGRALCRLEDEHGNPVARARVNARRSEPRRSKHLTRTTDAFGVCTFEKLPPGEWTFWPSEHEERTLTIELQPGATQHVTLRVPAR